MLTCRKPSFNNTALLNTWRNSSATKHQQWAAVWLLQCCVTCCYVTVIHLMSHVTLCCLIGVGLICDWDREKVTCDLKSNCYMDTWQSSRYYDLMVTMFLWNWSLIPEGRWSHLVPTLNLVFYWVYCQYSNNTFADKCAFIEAELLGLCEVEERRWEKGEVNSVPVGVLIQQREHSVCRSSYRHRVSHSAAPIFRFTYLLFKVPLEQYLQFAGYTKITTLVV